MKVMNQYAQQIKLYDQIPKAVLAAIAVSALTLGGDNLEEAGALVMDEWQVLHMNGIVPQEPPKGPWSR